jgi:hypothetical protein
MILIISFSCAARRSRGAHLSNRQGGETSAGQLFDERQEHPRWCPTHGFAQDQD